MWSQLSRLEELHVHWPAYSEGMQKLGQWAGKAHQALTKPEPGDRPCEEYINDQFNQIWVSFIRVQFFRRRTVRRKKKC